MHAAGANELRSLRLYCRTSRMLRQHDALLLRKTAFRARPASCYQKYTALQVQYGGCTVLSGEGWFRFKRVDSASRPDGDGSGRLQGYTRMG